MRHVPVLRMDLVFNALMRDKLRHALVWVFEFLTRNSGSRQKKNFRRSASATLLCVYVERREVSFVELPFCCD